MDGEHGITLFESGASVTPRSLVLYGLSFQAWEEAYRKMITVEESGPFWVGDCILWGEKSFGEQFAQALDEEHAKTHMIYRYVCSRIPPERRREALSFSIHREVCSLEDTAQQDKILDIAEQQNLVVREVREMVKAAKGDMKPAVDWWGKFERLIKDMWQQMGEDEFKAMAEKMRTHLEGVQ